MPISFRALILDGGHPGGGCLRIAARRAACALFVLACASTLYAQGEQSPSQTAKRILETPSGADVSNDSRVFSPTRIFGKQSADGIGLDLRERPAAPAPQLRLLTSIETKVENKTTNVLGSAQPGVAEAPPAPPQRGPAPSVAYEFTDFIQQSVGKPLPVFGADLFTDSTRNAAVDPMTVPADYRVGPGDELVIHAWGQIDIDFQGQIDRSGHIFIPKIGQIMVAGLPAKDVTEQVRLAVQKIYRNFDLTVTLGGLRQIQFYMMGFVRQPGVYTTASTASALHGLMTSGGILPYADLRHIELRRGGVTVATIDAYRFLLDGNRSNDPQLLPGDVLYVPAGKAFAAVAGSVRRPAIYHLAAGTTVDDLIKASGGLGFAASEPAVRIERLEAGRRVMEHASYNAAFGKRLVRDGELYMLLPVSPRIDNAVTLRGHVTTPLRQAWTRGMKVSDLIGSRDNLIRLASWVQRNERDTLLKLGDAARDNELKRDFPDVEWDYAAIERVDQAALSSSVKTFSLIKALAGDPANDIELQPGDAVVIYARSDFRQPQSKKLRLVKIEGEVNAPGVYPVDVGETLAEALVRAGGLTRQAYVFGTVFTRSSARRSEEERLRQAADRVEQDYLRYLAGRARNAIRPEEAAVGTSELDAIRSLVSRLRSVPALGRIPLGMGVYKEADPGYPAISLEDEDAVYIPHRPATVTLVGAIFQEGSQLWSPGFTVSSYVDGAGGLRPHANKADMVVIRADGTVARVGGWMPASSQVHPGDTIVVPEDVSSPGLTRLFRDWSQIFYQLGLGTAALKILRTGL